MRGFAAIPAAGLFYFFSAWIVMLFGGVIADDLGINTFSYGTALIITMALWLAVAPLAGAAASGRRGT